VVISSRMGGRQGEATHWRDELRRAVTALIALKIAALALLWWLFFSPAHRTEVDADGASRRLSLTQGQLQQGVLRGSSQAAPTAGETE
jgi:hypothetical protein